MSVIEIKAPEPASGHKTRDELIAENKQLTADLAVANLRIAGLSEQNAGFDRLNEDAITIASYLGQEFIKEIEEGRHAGRPLGIIVVGYLKELKEYRKDIPRWVRFLCGRA